MKRFSLASIFSILWYALSAQLSDKLWLGGYEEFPGVAGYGNFTLRFTGNSPQIQQVPLAFNFESTMAVATAPDGQLLFYTNGCEVANRLHEVMPNGDGLSPGVLSGQVCPWKGYIVPQGAMVLPMPGDSTRFYLFHMGAFPDPHRKLLLGPLYYSVVDMTLQNGLGDVSSKNNLLLDGDLSNFTAVRHGNGRDWWVLTPTFGNAQWFIFLITPQGIQQMPFQVLSIGSLGCEHHGQTAISPDGSKVANWGDCKMTVFDFDRCSGQLSAALEISAHGHWFYGGGAAFSPSGRYLYATDHNVLYRADLEDNFPTLDTMRFSYGVGNYDVPGNTFHYLVNGPDGRIYGNIPSRAAYFHALKNADGAGIDDIDFVPQSVLLPVTNVRTLPHFPNFRLYDLPGSLCDTLGIDNPVVGTHTPDLLQHMRLSPNPAVNILLVQWPLNSLTKLGIESGKLRVFDATGRLVVHLDIRSSTEQISLDVTHLLPGLYFLDCQIGRERWGGKFEKM